jgi:glycosyltransferase involved in cell wall biosynthesis
MGSSHVSAVIPTTLRPELPRAIASARAQKDVPVEIVVVVDRAESKCTAEELALTSGADLVLFTGGGKGGGHARNVGAENSTGSWVAFLDDDDTWHPSKIAAQRSAAEASHSPLTTVVSCQVVQSIGGTESTSAPVPNRVISPGDRVEEYLFRKRAPRLGRAAIFTSTLLVSREMAVGVKWDGSLRRHQDWDWLMRLQRDSQATFVQLPLIGSTIYIGSAGSISASSDWEGSLRWARSWKQDWSPSAYADFVAGQPLRYATQSRSLRGAFACLREILIVRRIPAIGPIVLGMGGFAPRGAALRLMVAGTRRAR